MKEHYIYIYLSNPDRRKNKLHPTELLNKHIELAKLNEEGYSYWGTNSKSGLHKIEYYQNILNQNKERKLAYEEIKNVQENYRILFFIGKTYSGFNRVYAIADIIDFEEYSEDRYSENKKWQVKEESTGEKSKLKYWFKLKNYEIISPDDNEFNLNNFYFKKSEKKVEENLREKIDGIQGRQPTILMVYRYALDTNVIKDEALKAEILNYDLSGKEDIYYLNAPKLKSSKYKSSQEITIDRDVRVAVNVLKLANHCCEYNREHKSFNRKKDGLPYMEAHHLIPMKYSDDFEYSLDIEENVVSLCSHCHNQIHYGEEWEQILKGLYEQRKDMLKEVGLTISYERLKDYYK